MRATAFPVLSLAGEPMLGTLPPGRCGKRDCPLLGAGAERLGVREPLAEERHSTYLRQANLTELLGQAAVCGPHQILDLA